MSRYRYLNAPKRVPGAQLQRFEELHANTAGRTEHNRYPRRTVILSPDRENLEALVLYIESERARVLEEIEAIRARIRENERQVEQLQEIQRRLADQEMQLQDQDQRD